MAKKRGGSGCMGIVIGVAILYALIHGGSSSSSSSNQASSIDNTNSSAVSSASNTNTSSSQVSSTSPAPAQTSSAPVASSAPAKTPASTPAPQEPKVQVKILSIVSPVPRNGTETVVAQVPPGTTASIEVDYASGPSHAAGLEDKTADSSGKVSWSWHVGGRTTLGSWPVIVSDNGASDQASFEVVH
jgi:micrococcal nuclease